MSDTVTPLTSSGLPSTSVHSAGTSRVIRPVWSVIRLKMV